MRFTRSSILAIGLTAALSLGFGLPALADPGHGHGNPHYGRDDDESYNAHGHKDKDKGDKDHDGKHGRGYRIDDRSRLVLDRYVVEDYHKKCPPGLKKKHNGCLPPGHARAYEVGYILPETVIYRPLPRYLKAELHPVPEGYKYVQVDSDVLLINDITRLVVDAITASSK